MMWAYGEGFDIPHEYHLVIVRWEGGSEDGLDLLLGILDSGEDLIIHPRDPFGGIGEVGIFYVEIESIFHTF